MLPLYLNNIFKMNIDIGDFTADAPLQVNLFFSHN